MTEDKEQESDLGEEETQVRKRKSSILRSIIHLFRCKRFPVRDGHAVADPCGSCG